MQYYSLQHQTLLAPPDISTTEHHFHFGPASFILSGAISPLFLSSILDTYWPGVGFGLIFQCHIFLPFHTVHGVLKARILKCLPFPSPVDHVWSELSTMNRLSWVALHGVAHSFIELHKAVIHVFILVSFL